MTTKFIAFEGGVMAIPESTIEISADQYQEAINGIVNGMVASIENGFEIKLSPPPEEPNLEVQIDA